MQWDVLYNSNVNLSIFAKYNWYYIDGDNMQVKIFDESHEKDLEVAINNYLDSYDIDVIDIKYNVAISTCGEDQIYCFSAMIIYH